MGKLPFWRPIIPTEGPYSPTEEKYTWWLYYNIQYHQVVCMADHWPVTLKEEIISWSALPWHACGSLACYHQVIKYLTMHVLQVLLISGGESLETNERVCKYTAGSSDSNPIFLFSVSTLEGAGPPQFPEVFPERDLQPEVCSRITCCVSDTNIKII